MEEQGWYTDSGRITTIQIQHDLTCNYENKFLRIKKKNLKLLKCDAK